MRRRLLFCWVLLCIGTAAVFGRAAPVRVCVEVASDSDEAGLRELVLSEVARHPSHRVVEAGCETTLLVKRFLAEGDRYLTARIGREVPVRYRLEKADEMAAVLKRALSLVLGSDPVHLTKDISRYSRIERASHSLLKKGNNCWRAEIFEILGRGEGSLSYASGAAFSATRGADHLQIFARVHLAGRPGKWAVGESGLRISSGLDLGLIYEVSELSSTTFYFGGGLGAHYLRYEGRLMIDGAPDTEAINEVMPQAFFRLGVRFLRIYDFDLDLFAAGFIPFLKVKDQDSPLFGERGLYTPSGQLGLGVGF